MVDRYEQLHTPNLELVPAWRYDFVVRVNDTLDMMASEEELLSWNMMALGGLLNKFIYFLVDGLCYREYIDNMVATSPTRSNDPASRSTEERYAIAFVLANEVLGPLQFLDSVEDHVVIDLTLDCFLTFFAEVNPRSYQYFTKYNAEFLPVGTIPVPTTAHRMAA
jgi:hypothetical protein